MLFSEAKTQTYGDEIISWDFNNGIPSDWENITESGISSWEYRGPNTDPDLNVASQGACGLTSEPIASTTQNNGFVIFDSSFWDDPIGPCGTFGQGEDPGPHHADLITPSLDFSNNTSLVLNFQQQYWNFQSEAQVHVSADGGENYTLVHQNSTQTNYNTGDVQFVSVNLSSIAANQSNVKIKFTFSGESYYWMLDDIVIYEPNDDDLFLLEARNTNYGMVVENGIRQLEYTKYAQPMVQPFQFHADVLNIGNNTQNNLQLNTKVFNENDELLADLFSANETSISIDPVETLTLNTEIWNAPTELGNYRVEFNVTQDEVDEAPENNLITKEYEVTEYTWARDQDSKDGEYIPAAQYEGAAWEQGNYFDSNLSGVLKCTSISFAVSDSSEVGGECYAKIYKFGGSPLVAESTELYELNAYDLNANGESKMITIQLDEPLLIEDTLYLAMVGSPEINGTVRMATSGISPSFTSILQYPEQNGVFYTLVTPMVRMNLFPLDSNPGCTNELAFNYDPNADTDDGSCRIAGCTEPLSQNYDSTANWDDGSCIDTGCGDPEADNYNPDAEIIDNSLCIYLGCTDSNANNFDSIANQDDGSCLYNEAALQISQLSGCAPLDIELTNQTATTENSECLITLGDGTQITDCQTTSFMHQYNEPGVYIITYTYSVNDFESEVSFEVEVFENPEVPEILFESESNLISCTNCDEELNYTWFLNDEILQQDAPTEIFNPGDGSFVLQVSTENGCTGISDVEVVSSITELDKKVMHVFPNPASEEIFITGVNLPLEYSVLEMNGKEVYTGTLTDSNSLNLSSLAPGIYTLFVQKGELKFVEKLIKD